jgi:hypothetical protein
MEATGRVLTFKVHPDEASCVQLGREMHGRHFVETSQRRVDSPQDTAHVSLPRRGRNMAAQGK